jgi:hypothetical protein
VIEIALLGALVLVGTDDQEIAVASVAQRRLVSALGMHSGSVVRAGSLENWLGLSPGALRTSISRLRRLIGPDALVTTPPGYTLHATVDVAEFVEITTRVPALGDDAALAALDEAVGL